MRKLAAAALLLASCAAAHGLVFAQMRPRRVEQPFTVALVIDTSGSTRFKMEEMQDAAIAFLDQLRPNDRVVVVSFDDDVRVLSEPTSDRSVLRAAIRRTRTGDGTRLYDAVDLVIRQHLSRVQGRKAIVLFTDGVD